MLIGTRHQLECELYGAPTLKLAKEWINKHNSHIDQPNKSAIVRNSMNPPNEVSRQHNTTHNTQHTHQLTYLIERKFIFSTQFYNQIQFQINVMLFTNYRTKTTPNIDVSLDLLYTPNAIMQHRRAGQTQKRNICK